MSKQAPANDSPGTLETVLLYAFPIVDALAWERFIGQKFLTFFTSRRVVLSNGSVLYEFRHSRTTRDNLLITVKLRMLNEHATLTTISAGPALPTEAYDSIVGFFEAFLYGILYNEHLRTQTLILEAQEGERRIARLRQPLPAPSINLEALASINGASQRAGQHVSWPEDDWAWEQVHALGRPRMEVREEWIKRLSQERRLADLPRSFRYAISPKRKPKRKAED